MQGSSGVGEPARASLATTPRTGRRAAKTSFFGEPKMQFFPSFQMSLVFSNYSIVNFSRVNVLTA